MPESDEEEITINVPHEELECIFIEAIYNSFGASLVDKDRISFDLFVKKTSELVEIMDRQDNKVGCGKL